MIELTARRRLMQPSLIAVVLAGSFLARASVAAAPESPAAQAETLFEKCCAEKSAAAERADTMTVRGKDGWLFLGKELRHLSVGKFWAADAVRVSRAGKPEQADPLPAILDFKAQLDGAGIELLLVPVPPKAVIFPAMLCDSLAAVGKKPPRLDPHLQAFYKLLGGKGVEVLDLTDDFIAQSQVEKEPLYCRQDSHWSGAGCRRAAEQIAAKLAGRPWLSKAARLRPVTESKRIEIAGDLWQALPGSKPPAEKVLLRMVGSPDAAAPIEPDRASPIILLGDSHNLVFHSGGDMHARGAGLADQLAAELGLAVDLIAVRGSGGTPARINLLRQARANPKYLAQKKLIIWCFAAREFTESPGWQKVPVVK